MLRKTKEFKNTEKYFNVILYESGVFVVKQVPERFSYNGYGTFDNSTGAGVVRNCPESEIKKTKIKLKDDLVKLLHSNIDSLNAIIEKVIVANVEDVEEYQ